MIQYSISCTNRLSQIVQISLSFEVKTDDTILLELPAWRPGRYEFQTYARNIFDLKAYDDHKNELFIEKSSRNAWSIATPPVGKITVHYQYSCTQLDAGGSWIDDCLIYINPINCLLYVKGSEEIACQLTLNFPDTTTAPASALLFQDQTVQVENYFGLADSPFFISEQQEHLSYQLGEHLFHIWMHGELSFSSQELLDDFKAFTVVQLNAMKTFPEKEYHFLLLLFPFTHYHGVEHHQSTVITLGPSQELNKRSLYEELISISSHELYHAWNICKIRPREMYPYRLYEENYFRTGFVAEGITTYLGEYFLRQSSFFSEERFLLEIEQWINRHRMHRGLQRASLADSSFDLWVDGYVGSAVDYKVSIYVAGALSAIALDLTIRLATKDKSIFDLMQTLYQEKALKQEGYTEAYLQKIIQSLIGGEGDNFWSQCITGTTIDAYVIQLLIKFGITVQEVPSPYMHERLLGMKLKALNTQAEIAKLHIDSVSALYFMPDDIILSVNQKPVSQPEDLEVSLDNTSSAEFEILRKGRRKNIAINYSQGNYWSKMTVQKNSGASDEEKLRYASWITN